jgi:hypothetical protein
MQIELRQFMAALPPDRIVGATRLGLTLAPRLDPAAWRTLVAQVAGLARTATGARQTLTAWLGDALAYGGEGGRGLITECAAATGLDAGTLRNAKMVCSRIPVSCRHDALSWTHHCEVGLAFAEPYEISRWLQVAEVENLSTAELRRRVRAHIAGKRAGAAASPKGVKSSVAVFQLMRDLRGVSRRLGQQQELWQSWSPDASRLALAELVPLTEFVDAVRARAFTPGPAPRNPGLN